MPKLPRQFINSILFGETLLRLESYSRKSQFILKYRAIVT